MAEWQLSTSEAGVLTSVIKDELDKLPIPVEPADVPGEQERLAGVIREALD